jgi:GNAT superfamily N-acetyltransferase
MSQKPVRRATSFHKKGTSKSINLKEVTYQPLTEDNLEAVHELFKGNEKFYQIPLECFRRGTLEDESFDSNLTLILNHPETNKPIAAFVAVIRKGWVRKNCYLKACVVDKPYQRQGIGSKMLFDLMRRGRRKLHWYSSIRFGDSCPNYWTPGVDLRHTSLFFFLKKNGFTTKRMRMNLTCSLANLTRKPESSKNGYRFERVRPNEFEATAQFVKKNFRFGFWSREVRLSYRNDPPTTFIAKDRKGTIVGWASHSISFPESFGPTGITKALRKRGLGGELMKWCLWDMREAGLDTATIRWVEGDTIKFYSKVFGAYVCPVFYPMSRLI